MKDGTIYVPFRLLADMSASPNVATEDALAFLLAHELSHILHYHFRTDAVGDAVETVKVGTELLYAAMSAFGEATGKAGDMTSAMDKVRSSMDGWKSCSSSRSRPSPRRSPGSRRTRPISCLRPGAGGGLQPGPPPTISCTSWVRTKKLRTNVARRRERKRRSCRAARRICMRAGEGCHHGDRRRVGRVETRARDGDAEKGRAERIPRSLGRRDRARRRHRASRTRMARRCACRRHRRGRCGHDSEALRQLRGGTEGGSGDCPSETAARRWRVSASVVCARPGTTRIRGSSRPSTTRREVTARRPWRVFGLRSRVRAVVSGLLREVPSVRHRRGGAPERGWRRRTGVRASRAADAAAGDHPR